VSAGAVLVLVYLALGLLVGGLAVRFVSEQLEQNSAITPAQDRTLRVSIPLLAGLLWPVTLFFFVRGYGRGRWGTE